MFQAATLKILDGADFITLLFCYLTNGAMICNLEKSQSVSQPGLALWKSNPEERTFATTFVVHGAGRLFTVAF